MQKYSKQTRLLLAVDCVIFGFDGDTLKILLIKRGFEPEKNNWSLMGGFVEVQESLDQAANRILKQLTGSARCLFRAVTHFWRYKTRSY
jgi:8-oxo-dGTP diphosphatase